jgi:hypothetical protein
MSEIVNDVVAVDTVAPVVVENPAPKAPRNANVSDEAILTAWEKTAIAKSGTVQTVADELGMKKASLVQRVQSLKKLGIKLTDMPRQKSTGAGGKKKDPQTVLDILARVRASLAPTTLEAPTEPTA